MQDLDEQVMTPSQESTEEDINYDCIFPSPPPPIQEFQPQPSTSRTTHCEPTQESSQDDLMSEKSPESSDCVIIDSSDEEDSLIRISNTFCSIKPPKSALLAPPATTVNRDLPILNTFKPPIVKKKIKSNIKNIICHLRELVPLIDSRTLTLLNVLDHVYNGSNKPDDPRQIKVTFNPKVDYAFRSKFLSVTKEGKDGSLFI